jgi:YD repeat-containing protein
VGTPSFTAQNLLTGTLQDLNYTYDAVGNITQIRDDVASETSDYAYDSLDRLTSWTLNSTPESYTYDASTGNLATKAGSAFTYDANQPHGVSALNGNTYGYDANGNQTSRVIGGQTYTLGYDAEGHLVSVSGPR